MAHPEPKSFLALWIDAFKDTTLIILIVLAILSLIIAFAVEHGKDLSWLDGTAILATVLVVTRLLLFTNTVMVPLPSVLSCLRLEYMVTGTSISET